MRLLQATVLSLLLLTTAWAIDKIAPNSTVYIEPMGGFDVFLSAAIAKKKVPITVITEKERADYEITGASDSQKAGWARVIFLAQTGSNEEASVKMVNRKTSAVVFAYAVHKRNSVRGKQSAAEACAKHIKEYMSKN